MKSVHFRFLCMLLIIVAIMCGCAKESQQTAIDSDIAGSMDLSYAGQFSVDYLVNGTSLITIAGKEEFLLVPENIAVPENIGDSIIVLKQPLDNIYLAASSAMDYFARLDALGSVRFTSTKSADWTLDEVKKALDNGGMIYAGKYSAPDYELLLSQGTSIAIENTMIWHSPQTQEQLEGLGIPVLIDRSSYESHPLGRMEWIKLYGLLVGKEAEAAGFFDKQVKKLDRILNAQKSSACPTVAFFYITNNGSVNVRKSGDYISKMIEMAGGRYILSENAGDENALSTTNMQMEAFYAAACDADILIYNTTVDDEMYTLDDLLQKSELMEDFKAVRNGNVWRMGGSMFQQTTGLADLLVDLHSVITGEADTGNRLTFLSRVE